VVASPHMFAGDAIRILSATPVKIPIGGSARVNIATPSAAFAGRFDLELRGAPEGISLEKVSSVENGIELVIAADMAKTGVGTKGNLIVDVTSKNVPPAPDPKKSNGKSQRASMATMPAIPFEVVAE
jgi:hypothetical protein